MQKGYRISVSSKEDKKLITIRLSEQHENMLRKIADKVYRMPNSKTHAIRCMIEDKYKEIANQ